jgi:hypothetical protein
VGDLQGSPGVVAVGIEDDVKVVAVEYSAVDLTCDVEVGLTVGVEVNISTVSTVAVLHMMVGVVVADVVVVVMDVVVVVVGDVIFLPPPFVCLRLFQCSLALFLRASVVDDVVAPLAPSEAA